MKISLSTFIKSTLVLGLTFGLAVQSHAQTEESEKKPDEIITHSSENRGSVADENVSSKTPLNSLEATMINPKPGVDQIVSNSVQGRGASFDEEITSMDVSNRISAEHAPENYKPDIMTTRAQTVRGEFLEEKLEEPTVINQRNSPVEFAIPPHKKRDR